MLFLVLSSYFSVGEQKEITDGDWGGFFCHVIVEAWIQFHHGLVNCEISWIAEDECERDVTRLSYLVLGGERGLSPSHGMGWISVRGRGWLSPPLLNRVGRTRTPGLHAHAFETREP
ncbi:uncharacterized protein MYCFIDRAFT_207073 [Pseudocercospora fijiensis CIRAD86]|uniref:Uncharacterized protein n=1 Tax=Pseudocercospora fijiensis (strain CIRAD86) TaxID=383855 RepID=M3B382_PSEFD|nr:uncharacterized protein MYCFIDRAFT_207073 [Pseudocercospora fijiensis CIRAD86]EME83827.1 hypothetical protein MYCFIDRAFT_207073 [Pseudocercospora fijiensis CIRAD86]